jgi:hypothetical protein
MQAPAPLHVRIEACPSDSLWYPVKLHGKALRCLVKGPSFGRVRRRRRHDLEHNLFPIVEEHLHFATLADELVLHAPLHELNLFEEYTDPHPGLLVVGVGLQEWFEDFFGIFFSAVYRNLSEHGHDPLDASLKYFFQAAAPFPRSPLPNDRELEIEKYLPLHLQLLYSRVVEYFVCLDHGLARRKDPQQLIDHALLPPQLDVQFDVVLPCEPKSVPLGLLLAVEFSLVVIRALPKLCNQMQVLFIVFGQYRPLERQVEIPELVYVASHVYVLPDVIELVQRCSLAHVLLVLVQVEFFHRLPP